MEPEKTVNDDPRYICEVFTGVLFEPGAMYRLCKDMDGYQGDGTFLLVQQRVSTYYGVRDRQIFYEPLSTYDQALQVQQRNAALNQGGAPEWALDGVMISFRIFPSAYTATEGKLPLPSAGESESGVHAVFVNGWDDYGESLGFDNSWGRAWGDSGHGSMSRSYFDKYLVDAWLRRRCRVGPSAFNWHRITSASSPRELARAWMIGNPRWIRRSSRGRRGIRYDLYETLSAADECPVEVIEIRTGRGFRVAWAHLFHRSADTPNTSVLKELFVWPKYRRQGFGSELMALALARARVWGDQRLQLYLHDIDDFRGVLSPGRKFGEAMGYKWRWGRYTRPNLRAVGEVQV